MLYTKLTQLAMKIAFEVHKEQVDKSGVPYIYHPIHLAEQMESEAEICTALLHDTVEDGDISVEDLRNYGFTDEILGAVELLTHNSAVPYMEYVAKIKGNPIAKRVKLADLTHNSDLTRLPLVDERAMLRRKKYSDAIALLLEDKNSAHKYYRFESGMVFRKNGGTGLFESFNGSKWVPNGWVMNKFYDAASEYTEIYND